jgi:hypothetical protein
MPGLDMVVHVCNYNYMGGRHRREDKGLRLPQAKAPDSICIPRFRTLRINILGQAEKAVALHGQK